MTVSMSIISGGTILGCLTVFLGGGFELWDCRHCSLSSIDSIVLYVVFIVLCVASIICVS